MTHERLRAQAEELTALGERPALPCPDPVNQAMIRNWAQALGDTDPRWLGEGLAPPAMLQVWSMPGLVWQKGLSAADQVMRLLNEAGYTGVVATNCEHSYDRYLRHGERLRSTMRFGGLDGPKKTGMGEGYFVTWHQTWYDENDQRVGEMLFRVLKFQPRKRRPKGQAPRPAIGLDTQFFWDGVHEGELRIQRCADCGALRHPPGPMCPSCQSTRRDHVKAAGQGEVHSYVVHHHPPVPGRTPPYVVALIDLPEGVRMIGNILGCPPDDVKIGMPVKLTFEHVDDELTLPQWAPADYTEPEPEPAAPADLEIPLTPTLIIAAALATRDFNPVHHDTGRARAQGTKDIFLNILTTMGLVQRAVLHTIPDAVLDGIAVKLGVPAYAGDTLRLTTERVDATTVKVRGAVSLGDHVTATVRIKETG